VLDVLNRVGTAAATGLLGLPEPVVRRLAGPPLSMDGVALQPAVQLMLRLNHAVAVVGGESDSVARRRQEMVRGARLAMAPSRQVTVAAITISTPDAALSARRYRDHGWSEVPRPVIMYLHGGGWVVGTLDSHDAVCRQLALGSGCTVVSVDYRLAPEHPFPAAVIDVIAAFRWLRDHPQPEDLPGVVAVMGDSAGGNLAAVTSMAMRDAGELLPAAQGLIYPGTDLRMGLPSIDKFADGFFLTKSDMEWYRSHYAPHPDQWRNPQVSPLLAKDHRGLPPTAVWTAGFDPLRDEGAAYAQRLRDSGTTVQEHCFTDQVHGFANMGFLPGGVSRTRSLGRQVALLIGDPE
jgi:acetyl esterase